MRHRYNKKRLNRDSAHRISLLKNLSSELIMHESIETTLSKAKFFRSYLEKLVTKARNKTYPNVSYIKSILGDEASRKLFDDIAPRFKDRNGGYTRILKSGVRGGDAAKMARIEFVEKKK